MSRLDDENYRVDYSKQVSVGIASEINANMGRLPDVCESGAECRKQIEKNTMIDVEKEWQDALKRIQDILISTTTTTKKLLTDAWEEKFQCEPGCYCDQISVEYLDVLRFEKEITEQIEMLNTDLVYLEEKMHGVEITCPDYTITHWDQSTYTSTVVGTESTSEEVGREIVSERDLSPQELESSSKSSTSTFVMEEGHEDSSEVIQSQNVVGNGESDWEVQHDQTLVVEPETIIINDNERPL